MRSTDVRGLWIAAALGAACALLLVVPGIPQLLSALGAAALVLALPGYAVTRALFPGRTLDAAEQAAMTVGLSISLAIVAGLILNVLPWGLTESTWGWLLGGLTLAACGVAWQRVRARIVATRSDLDSRGSAAPEGPAPASPAPAVGSAAPASPAVGTAAPGSETTASPGSAAASASASAATMAGRRAAVPGLQVAMLVVAAGLVLAALGVARLGVVAQPQTPFTQLWLLPDPTGTSVQIGVTSHEGTSLGYRLVVLEDAQQITQWFPVDLADGATWQVDYALPPGGAVLHTVDVQLFRPTDTSPYRETHVSIRRVVTVAATAAPASVGPAPTTGPTP